MFAKYLRCLGISFAVLMAGHAFAQSVFEPGDILAGEQLYGINCQSCHGINGNSLVPSQPIIASQYTEYLQEQLRAYRSGDRANAIMSPFAQNLSDTDIADLASFLATQNAGLSGAVDRKLAERGRQLYYLGNPSAAVPSCNGCHGPAGAGIPPLYPRLSGQHADYTNATLNELRSGTRVNAVMNEIAANLTDEDIAALAEFISGLY